MRTRSSAPHIRYAPITLWFGSALLLAACSADDPTVDNRIAVKTFVVGSVPSSQGGSGQARQYAGSIASSFESDVAFRVGGRMVARRVNLGDRVGTGSPLAVLDPAPFRLAARSAQASVEAVRAELAQAESELARNAPLGQEHIVAPAQIGRLRAQRDSARARLRDMEAREAAARDDIGYATLQSPASGVVTQVSAEVGEYFTAGQAAFRVARPDALDAIVDVPESIVSSLRTGMPAAISVSSSQGTVPGRIREISPAADPATRTYRIKVALNTIGPARIGMTARVSFPSSAMSSSGEPALVIPLTAVAQAGKLPAVWIVKSNGTLELRRVGLGSYTNNGVIVSAGLRSGERIVSAGVHRLDAQQRVKLWDGRLP